MKQCPGCGTKYTDPTLKYCLADGAGLIDVDEEPTVTRRVGGEPIRVSLAQPAEKTAVLTSPQPMPAPSRGSGMLLKIALGVIVLGFLGVSVIAVAALVYYNSTTKGPTTNRIIDEPNRPANRMTPVPTPTIDDMQDLKEQIANLEKQLKQQQGTNKPANIPLTLPNQTTIYRQGKFAKRWIPSLAYVPEQRCRRAGLKDPSRGDHHRRRVHKRLSRRRQNRAVVQG